MVVVVVGIYSLYKVLQLDWIYSNDLKEILNNQSTNDSIQDINVSVNKIRNTRDRNYFSSFPSHAHGMALCVSYSHCYCNEVTSIHPIPFHHHTFSIQSIFKNVKILQGWEIASYPVKGLVWRRFLVNDSGSELHLGRLKLNPSWLSSLTGLSCSFYGVSCWRMTIMVVMRRSDGVMVGY